MSARIVEERVMCGVVYLIMSECQKFADIPTARRADGHAIGRKLYAANTEAVRERYEHSGLGDKPWAAGIELVKCFEYYQGTASVSSIQNWKHMANLLYQCSEGDVMQQPIMQELERLHDRLGAALLKDTREYDRAEWL